MWPARERWGTRPASSAGRRTSRSPGDAQYLRGVVMHEPMEPKTSTRRGLLGALARAAARHTGERADVPEALGPGGLNRLLASDDSSAETAAGAALPRSHAITVRRPARSPEPEASLDELLILAHAEGLTQRDDELRGLAMRSLRLTIVEPAAADAWIVTSDEWITAVDAALVALINLEAATIHRCGLPTKGWLALFVDADDSAAGLDVRHAHGVVLDFPAAISDVATPVALGPELVLPRRWHEAVQALGLDDTEADAYDRLRTRAQLLQGVESEDNGGPDIAYHRLLGYPNETTGSMPADCIRALHNWSAADEPGTVEDPASTSHEWRLLAQVSVGERRRTYLWIRQADLDAGKFDKLGAFVR